MHRFGDFAIAHFVERTFRLDGGSMFGVVPKKIWGRLVKADGDNLIPMRTNLFVVTTGKSVILCDTGLGSVLTQREQKVYAVEGESGIEAGLAGLGYSTADIDHVFLSHLHTDHAGGTVYDNNGSLKPRFPRARYLVQMEEWRDAMDPDERTGPVYVAERLRVLEKAGQIDLFDGDALLEPGVRLVKTGGHTPGHMGIEFSSGGETIVYYADIIPSAHHFKIPYVASVDLFPRDTMRVKRSLTERALAGEIGLAFDHDPDMAIVRARREGIRVIIEPIGQGE